MTQPRKNRRREIIKSGALLSAAGVIGASRALGQQCALTPPQTDGPFYPLQPRSQWENDADLVTVAGRNQPATGEVVVVEGEVIDQHCETVSGARVEVWQADHQGVYNHPNDPRNGAYTPDRNFQFWDQMHTDGSGRFSFRSIVPGAYPAGNSWIRPSHIHIKVVAMDHITLTTQIYFAPHPNDRHDEDVLRRVPDLLQLYRDEGGEAVTRQLHRRDAILNNMSPSQRDQVILQPMVGQARRYPLTLCLSRVE